MNGLLLNLGGTDSPRFGWSPAYGGTVYNRFLRDGVRTAAPSLGGLLVSTEIGFVTFLGER